MPQIVGHCHIYPNNTSCMSTIQVYTPWQPTPTNTLAERLPVEMDKSLSERLPSSIKAEDLMGLSWMFFEDEY
jgi:hypothetical protein